MARDRFALCWRKSLVGIAASSLVMQAASGQEAELRQQVESLQQQVSTLQSQMSELKALLQKLQPPPAPAASPQTAAPNAAAGAPGAVPPPAPGVAAATPLPAAPAAAAPAITAESSVAIAPEPRPPEEPATTFGGYGELTYNNYVKDSSRNQADLRRLVILFGHRFNDQLIFNSEVEWEHAVASASDRGETEIEQAFLDYNFNPGLSLKAGLFLMPFNFLNLAHEPPVYYGVERNFVETNIIPTTWREGGAGLYGETVSGWAWDFGVTTGFDIAKFDDPAAPLASMHQELSLANAHDLAGYVALNYKGIPGLTAGGAVFHGDSGQGNADYQSNNTLPNFAGIRAPVTLWEMHARWQADRLDLQALYTRGHIGQAGQVDDVLAAYNAATGNSRPYVPEEFYGWLAQGAYTVWHRGDMSLTPFVRYEQFNTQARMPAGFAFAVDPVNADRVWTLGLSFRPHPQVVFKADYQRFLENSINNRFNLGMGFMF